MTTAVDKPLQYVVDLIEGGGTFVWASIGNCRDTRFEVDTGSLGIVVAEQYLQSGKYELTQEPCEITYDSSGYGYSGFWIIADVDFANTRGDVRATTRRMHIRMVNKWTKDGKPVDKEEKVSIAMMGVGFARGPTPGTKGIPYDINPFLLLDEMTPEGGMVPGFIITLKTITLGLTETDLKGFQFVQLERNESVQPSIDEKLEAYKLQWIAPNVSVEVVDSGIPSFSASLLVDTGINYCMVYAPEGTKNPPFVPGSGNQVADKQHIILTHKDLSRPMYDFSVGQPGEISPKWVSWGHSKDPFINTGVRALSQVDYLFDQQKGRLGFKFK